MTVLDWMGEHPFLTFFLGSGLLYTLRVIVRGHPRVGRDQDDDG